MTIDETLAELVYLRAENKRLREYIAYLEPFAVEACPQCGEDQHACECGKDTPEHKSYVQASFVEAMR